MGDLEESNYFDSTFKAPSSSTTTCSSTDSTSQCAKEYQRRVDRPSKRLVDYCHKEYNFDPEDSKITEHFYGIGKILSPKPGSVVQGANHDIEGNDLIVSGDGHKIYGNDNQISGNGLFVKGNRNVVTGNDNVVLGLENDVKGKNNRVSGRDNINVEEADVKKTKTPKKSKRRPFKCFGL
jgi:hypothetical protein